jgi:hypothetical protein
MQQEQRTKIYWMSNKYLKLLLFSLVVSTAILLHQTGIIVFVK